MFKVGDYVIRTKDMDVWTGPKTPIKIKKIIEEGLIFYFCDYLCWEPKNFKIIYNDKFEEHKQRMLNV